MRKFQKIRMNLQDTMIVSLPLDEALVNAVAAVHNEHTNMLFLRRIAMTEDEKREVMAMFPTAGYRYTDSFGIEAWKDDEGYKNLAAFTHGNN